jgi:DNA-binding GntR family transcriptional regulator
VTNRTFKPLRASSKSNEVFEQLQHAIWTGSLAPGTPLREAHLAKQMNVSQVPVREALLRLEHLGLVLRIPDRGTTVTQLTRTEIEQMMVVRAHLEVMAFQLAAQHLTPKTLEELRDHLKKIRIYAAERDHLAVAEEDFAFHKTVWEASGNTILASTLERLCMAVFSFVSLKRHESGEVMRAAAKRHRLLLDVLLTKDATAIEASVRGHVNTTDLPDTVEK